MGAENIKISIARELRLVDEEIRNQLRHVCADDAFLDEILRAFFKGGGKKLRPKLLLLSAFALRGDELLTPSKSSTHSLLISLAAAVELVHSASLMHDDVLDRALLRRGGESVNALFGDKIAILSGDILYSRVFEILVKRSSRDIILMLTSCVRRMCRAEIADLSPHGFDTYKSIIEDKTASLMTFCCTAGTHVVRHPNDTPELMTALQHFGYCFGMVYQLTDDLRDGDSEALFANRDQALALLQKYMDAATDALAVVPDSPYKADISSLLKFVVEKADPLTSSVALTETQALTSMADINMG